MYYANILLSSSKIFYIVIKYISLILFITFFTNVLVNYLDATKYLFELEHKRTFITFKC